MNVPSRDELREHLVATMIAGDVATPRQNNLLHYRRMANGDPYYLFGLTFERPWTERDVLAMMAERCGVNPDPTHFYGDDTIDPDLTLDALEAMAARIGKAAADRETVVMATGHPATLMPVYTALGHALAERGCRILTPAAGWSYDAEVGAGTLQRRRIRYHDDMIAALDGDDGRAHHTHDPFPMEAMLAELAANITTSEPSPAEEFGNWPDLAIADHGWAGAAGQAGIDTVGFADCNDPALFAGEVEGRILVTVPLDDGVLPVHYAPLTAFLLSHAGLIA
ncbi:phosphatase [Thermomonospora umbrina]|uniref:Histidinol phosphate phosphatase hisN-like protein n=1 Tax=Thermomonospora umbrina TaxID=111806 RepID=A0A3D9SPW1_9ACTN|nr:phosphatase [Thermomonospora umbrina]REE97996.1 histidinol phosphate phosphatase hisN-like protein [Thermomonospora umbrina]